MLIVKSLIKNKIRNFILRLFPEIRNINGITNHNTILGYNTKIYPKAYLSNSVIGNYTYVSENSIIKNTTIGKFCSIGPNLLCGWGVHPTNGISTHPMFYSSKKQNGMTLSNTDKIEEWKQITIGNDVFIGMNVTIIDGVKIGDGAIIGAGAIVSKDIPPYSIAVGSPIQIIGSRFDDQIINHLLTIKWWDFQEDKLCLIEKHFFDIERAIEVFKK
jgi:acetyltransferase-like isoleucine patch superfamily enzyme